uniref:Mediator of RNA polymerase II transcription subunit 26 n=1 Tax=Globodera pallida TaxID=36090 RepID=A0A183CQH7_GLOPA
MQYAKVFQAGRQDVQHLNKQPKQQIQHQKDTLGQQVQYARDSAMQQVQYQAQNPKGFLTIRQQAQHLQQQQYQQVPYQKHFLGQQIQYPVNERQQIQHSNKTSCQQQQQQYPASALKQQLQCSNDVSRLQYPCNKMTSLHKTERRLTAEDVLSVDEPIIRQHPPVQRGPAGRFTSSTSSQLPRRDRTQANFLPSLSSAGIGIHRLESSNSAQNLPRPDWPQCAELAELFAFKPMTPLLFNTTSSSSSSSITGRTPWQPLQADQRPTPATARAGMG